MYKKDAETPPKSRDAPPDDVCLSKIVTLYPQEPLIGVKAPVDRVIKEAGWNHKHNVHERQQGRPMTMVLGGFEVWPDGGKWKVLSVYALYHANRDNGLSLT